MSRITELTGDERVRFAHRFWSKVGPVYPDSDACWQWIAGRNSHGYGQFSTFPTGEGRKFHQAPAPRVAYELLVGEIPDGLTIDHLCRNPACVNPAHMEAVTQRENTLRGTSPIADQARQTHCKNGHEFTPENTRIRAKDGSRKCRQCSNRRDRERYIRRKDEIARLRELVDEARPYMEKANSNAGPINDWLVRAEDGAARHPLIQTERPPEHVFEEFRKLHGAEDGATRATVEDHDLEREPNDGFGGAT